MNRDILSRRQGRQGHQVVIAVDGGQGVEMARSIVPNLIVMDMDLPVLDGWKATQQLKFAPEIKAIPIIHLRPMR